jgi:lipopolysaccharide heptosyltransferase II
MNIQFQRRLDRVLGTFICWLFSIFFRKDAVTSIQSKPKNLLVILLSEMGSLILAYPMFEFIGRKYPGASIHVLLLDQNKEILELIDVVPPGNILTVRNTSLIRMLLDSLRVLVKIRKSKIDAVIDCELFSRISSIYSFLSGAKIRAGFHPHTQEGLFRGEFIDRPVLYNPYHHISHQFITLAEAICSETIPKAKRLPVPDKLRIPPLKVSEVEIENASRRFKRDFPDVADKKLVLLYAGGGLLPIRAWPLENFCIVAGNLIHHGYAVGVIGLEEDKRLAKEILAKCTDNCIDLTGYTKSIRELVMIFHFASLLITNDGGPGHFAAMTPVPTIILYGPETPLLYGPLNSNSFSFYVPLSCSPCLTAYNHRTSPCDGDNMCLKSVSPQEVLEKAYEMLEG